MTRYAGVNRPRPLGTDLVEIGMARSEEHIVTEVKARLSDDTDREFSSRSDETAVLRMCPKDNSLIYNTV